MPVYLSIPLSVRFKSFQWNRRPTTGNTVFQKSSLSQLVALPEKTLWMQPLQYKFWREGTFFHHYFGKWIIHSNLNYGAFIHFLLANSMQQIWNVLQDIIPLRISSSWFLDSMMYITFPPTSKLYSFASVGTHKPIQINSLLDICTPSHLVTRQYRPANWPMPRETHLSNQSHLPTKNCQKLQKSM